VGCSGLQWAVLGCSGLQCVAEDDFSALQCVSLCCSVVRFFGSSVLQCLAGCSKVLQYVVVCCIVLQCCTFKNDRIGPKARKSRTGGYSQK